MFRCARWLCVSDFHFCLISHKMRVRQNICELNYSGRDLDLFESKGYDWQIYYCGDLCGSQRVHECVIIHVLGALQTILMLWSSHFSNKMRHP